jgi:hypothetical protein
MSRASSAEGRPKRERWVWWWGVFLTISCLGYVGYWRHVLFQFKGDLTPIDPELWGEIFIPLLVLTFVFLLIAFGACLWWYRISQSLSRRSVALRVVGWILFALSTFFVSFGNLRSNFLTVTYATKAETELPPIGHGRPTFYFGDVLYTYLLRDDLLHVAVSGALLLLAYLMVFRRDNPATRR